MATDPKVETARVGLISDTHGVLRPTALEALRGVDLVIHAGDVGDPGILDVLRGLAPVASVRGNVDHGAWAAGLPATAQVEVAGHWIHVLHAFDELDLDPVAAGFDVVVYGHSHRPEVRRKGGVLYVNPGSAGPRRFRLPVTLGILELEGREARVRIVSLDG